MALGICEGQIYNGMFERELERKKKESGEKKKQTN